jgi:hypothetical protein
VEGGEPRSGDRAFTALFFVLVAAALLFSDKGQISGDGGVRWHALTSLMDGHRLTEDRYTLEMPLLAVPLWAAGDAVAHASGTSGEERLEAIRRVVQRFNKVVAFGLALWAFRKLRTLGLSVRGAAAGVVGLLFASLLVPNAKDFYSECLWTLFACVAVGLLAAGNRRTRGGDAVLAAAAAFAIPLDPLLGPILAATGVVLAMSAARGERRAAIRGAALVALGVALGALLSAGENVLRRGSALDFGYESEGFTASLVTGLAGQLFSPARGAVFYLPAFFLGFVLCARLPAGEARRFVLAAVVFGSALILAYAKWHAWHGMTYWGPRFLLPLSVFGALFVALAAGPAWRAGPAARATLVAVVALSYAAYKVGVGIGVGPLLECLRPDPARLSCYWDPARLPFASWLSRADCAAMLSHRSTAVEIGTLALFAALTARGRGRRASAPPAPERR